MVSLLTLLAKWEQKQWPPLVLHGDLEYVLTLNRCNITTANLFFEEYFDLDQAETYRRQWKSEAEKRLAFERWDRTNWRRYL